ncbi:MAG: hypothetical protein IKU25_06050 [Clostridia bacterium]|nr:hypothetical protein [Clostridia bacterium]
MKIIISKVIVIVLILAVVLNCVACSNIIGQAEKENDAASQDQAKEQKIKYVEDYMKEKFPKDVSFSVEKISQESECYVAEVDVYTATSGFIYENVAWITVWVDNEGNIIDDYFLVDFNDDISSYFSLIAREEIPNCVVYVAPQFRNMPTKEWDISQDNVEEMIKTEDMYYFINIYINDSDKATQDNINNLSSKFSFCNSKLTVYNCDYYENGKDSAIEYEVIINKK